MRTYNPQNKKELCHYVYQNAQGSVLLVNEFKLKIILHL